MKKILYTLTEMLKTGLSPAKLAFTVSLGIALAMWPTLGGISTLLLFLSAFLFRLNIPLLVALNYLFWPLQILMLIPHIEIGAFLFGNPEAVSLHTISALVSSGMFHFAPHLIHYLLYAVLGWCFTAFFLVSLLTLLLIPVFRAFSSSMKKPSCTTKTSYHTIPTNL